MKYAGVLLIPFIPVLWVVMAIHRATGWVLEKVFNS